MIHLKNEKGYALVLALLIIVVFMVTALFVMGRSFTSVKQNKAVEKNYQSVALAEMGVSFFQTAVKNAFETNREEVLQYIQEKKADDLKKEVYFPDEHYAELALNRLAGKVENSVMSENLHMILQGEESSYEIKDPSFLIKSESIEISFISVGEEEGKQASLRTEMTIPMKKVEEGIGSGEEKDQPGYGPPQFDTIELPEVKERCKNPHVLDNDCDSVLLTEEKTYSGNNSKVQKELIYSTSHLTLSGNTNHLDASKIHTDGNFTVGKNMNNAEGIYIEVGGRAFFENHLDISNSDLLVKKDLMVDQHLTISNGSFIYVGGNVKIGHHLNLDASSKMCVAGNLEVSKKENIAGELYVKGSGGNGSYFNKEGEPVYLDEEEFHKVCGSKIPEPLMIQWGTIENNVEYTY
jgi:hypothetical protein